MQSKNMANHKMRIAYLLDDTFDKPDGVQQCVRTIGEHMRMLGHDVHYIVAESHNNDVSNIHSLAKFVALKFNGNSVRTPLPVSKRKIKELLEELNVDVLHVQMPFSPFFAGRVIKQASSDVRIVGTWHTFPTGRLQRLSHKPLHFMIRKSLLRVAVTIGVSRPTSEFADSIYGTKSKVIPNAVNIDRFKITVGKSQLKRIVFLGRFDERKGPRLLIEALNHIKILNLLPDKLEVIMGGKGPDLQKCIELVNSYGMSGIFTFPGFIDESDKAHLLASADVSVFPSTGGEAFGISVVEAMASGQSIVLGGDNPGYRSILGDMPELLFDPHDTANFGAKIVHYLLAPESELKLKHLWLKNAAEQYDVKVVSESLLIEYTSGN